MGCFHITEEFTAFCIGKSIIIYDHRTSESRVLDVLDTREKQTTSQKNGASCETLVVAAKTSPDGQYFAVACEAKVVVVWNAQTWQQVASHPLIKRPMALALTQDSSTLLVADKSGDVYEFPLMGCAPGKDKAEVPSKCDADESGGPRPLLGHLSMLLDVVLSDDNQYIITCDRDEKIRVSHYPCSYDIHTFCLGHHEFVTQLSLLPGTTTHLLSCSGDGTLRLWDYLKGKCLCCLDTREHMQHTPSLLQHYLTYRQHKHLALKAKEEQKAQEHKTGKQEAGEHMENKNGEHKGEDSAGGEMRRVLPDYPAVKTMAVTSTNGGGHLVAAILDKIPAIFVYKHEGCQLTYTTTHTLSVEPHTVAWRTDTELVVVQGGPEGVVVFTFSGSTLQPLTDHPLVEVARKYKEHFEAWRAPLELEVLYKQRFDNVAQYLKKKEERLASEKAVQAGLIHPVKKGRWAK